MKLLIVGGGGREHALGWAIGRSSRPSQLCFAPGNAGTAQLGTNVNIGAEDLAALLALALKEQPELVVVGPEVPLAAGLADQLRAAGLKVFGPGAAGARLEASKVWAKEFMARHQIPTAQEVTFEECDAALNYLEQQAGPYVIKADGLAAGKGVLVTNDRAEARTFINEVMRDQIFGQAGTLLIIEEFLEGTEVSALAFCDTISGSIVPLEPACDYKRAYEGDAGPNTGGMGAYSPPALMDEALRNRMMQEVFAPTLRGLIEEGIDYRGIVYAGLIITATGPKVLEYNCRFGDPETQSLLPRLKSDLLDWLEAVAEGRLKEMGDLEWDTRPSVGVVLAAGGYPGPYQKGLPVQGLDDFESSTTDLFLFHAGTNLAENGAVVTNGGRIFNVIAMDSSIAAARTRVYNKLDEGKLRFEEMRYRRDIAAREVKGEV
ncbi:MAG: phosphoribosylamine--glycine ligase [Chloroflexota bacterium]|nr:phosphoribosylamine--glycine ligase [Chloroflexota bacterium]